MSSVGELTTVRARPELRLLLLCCAKICAESGNGEQIGALLRQGLDWEYLVKIAVGHGTMPVLYRCLASTCPGATPPAVLGELKEYFAGNAKRGFALTGELLQCLHLLSTHGIPAVPFKGPVLAALTYGDYAMRQYDDLDVLVAEKDVLRARDLLVSQGYVPEFQLNRAQEQAYLRSQSEVKMLQDGGEVIVELHWRITERHFSFPIDTKQLLERAVQVSLLGREIQTLSPEDLLLVLCVHGTKHLWERLGWICDVARVLVSHAALDWSAVVGQARSLGSERMLFLGLGLAADRLGAPVPAEVARLIRSDHLVRSLAEQVWQWLFLEPWQRPGDWSTWRFHMSARERWQDRLNHTMRLITTTTPGDWSAIRLPSALFPLYYLIRPFRLVKVYGSSLLRRGR